MRKLLTILVYLCAAAVSSAWTTYGWKGRAVSNQIVSVNMGRCDSMYLYNAGTATVYAAFGTRLAAVSYADVTNGLAFPTYFYPIRPLASVTMEKPDFTYFELICDTNNGIEETTVDYGYVGD